VVAKRAVQVPASDQLGRKVIAALPIAGLAGDRLQVREHERAILLAGDVLRGGAGPVGMVPRLPRAPGDRVGL